MNRNKGFKVYDKHTIFFQYEKQPIQRRIKKILENIQNFVEHKFKTYLYKKTFPKKNGLS